MMLSSLSLAESGTSINFDEQTKVFRIDAANVSYVFGVNERRQLQALYWGGRLDSSDVFQAPQSTAEPSSFDPSANVTREEFVAWGGGLYVEPDLKITFADGNRDLVLEYVSHTISTNKLTILLKDISREVYVKLEYEVDGATGIIRRSANILNKTSRKKRYMFPIFGISIRSWTSCERSILM
jgi:alpha-galactosidase